MNRRMFLAAAALGTAACSHRPQSPWRALTPEEAATLEAWCECLIPEDADAGAGRAGVVRFIDTQLCGKYKRHRKTYASVLAAMDTASRGAYRTPFASLPLARRTVLLDQFEKGEHRKAFDLVLDHSLQGYYGNPRHGGNAGFVSWRMLGVPPAPVRGRS
ncbi:MAG: gluconate 2-dehydrogenase subunit 3 family protein [Bryobacteraceae bacterium]|jgi:gluconate 2-dehydrogenase gamma chain